MATELKKHPIFADYAADINGNIYSLKFNRISEISKAPHTRGYHQFRIHINGVAKNYLVHRFVYECYNGLISDTLQCHHIDHNKQNNSLDNLQLVNQLENMQYAKEAGILYGTANPKHRYYNG